MKKLNFSKTFQNPDFGSQSGLYLGPFTRVAHLVVHGADAIVLEAVGGASAYQALRASSYQRRSATLAFFSFQNKLWFA